MVPYIWPVARAVPPTLEKRREVLQGLHALAVHASHDAQRRRDDIAAIGRDIEAIGRDCASIEQTFRETCREAAALIARSQARKRALAKLGGQHDDLARPPAARNRATALLKASPDDPEHPGWPAGTPGGRGGQFRTKDGDGGEASNNSVDAAVDTGSRQVAPHTTYADAANDNLTPEQTCLKAYSDSLAY